MKLCNTCEEVRDEKLFHKRVASKDGLAARCKTCQRVYDKARAGDPHREEARRIYAQTEQGRLTGNKAKAAYSKKNPVKIKAQAMVSRAIRLGNMVRLPCETCGGTEHIHGHHDDYSKPLNVRWLCSVHHRQWHKENGKGIN